MLKLPSAGAVCTNRLLALFTIENFQHYLPFTLLAHCIRSNALWTSENPALIRATVSRFELTCDVFHSASIIRRSVPQHTVGLEEYHHHHVFLSMMPTYTSRFATERCATRKFSTNTALAPLAAATSTMYAKPPKHHKAGAKAATMPCASAAHHTSVKNEWTSRLSALE